MKSAITQNTLFTGDCLYVLNGINSESVDLIYLDPPFNSKRFYSAPVGSKAAGASFNDMWSWEDVDEAYLERMVNDYPYLFWFIKRVGKMHSKAMMAYLTYMTQRILEMHRVLKPKGSLYLHCDPTASHYLKIVLDMVFDKGNYINEVVWCYSSGGASKKSFAKKHDTLLIYSKTKEYTFNLIKEKTYRNKSGAPIGKQEYFYDKGGKYVFTHPKDHWNIPIISVGSKERTGYPTQKPLKLLDRIIKASSNEGDTVLDPFCGCATTCVAAQQLNRKWIGIDVEEKSAELVADRLSDDAGFFSDFIHRTDVPVRTDVEIIDIIDPKNKKQAKEKLGKEYGKACSACGMDDYKNLEIDHITPKAKGGQDTYSNYQLLCGNCNRRKGDRPMEYLRAKIAIREKHMKHRVTFGV